MRPTTSTSRGPTSRIGSRRGCRLFRRERERTFDDRANVRMRRRHTARGVAGVRQPERRALEDPPPRGRQRAPAFDVMEKNGVGPFERRWHDPLHLRQSQMAVERPRASAADLLRAHPHRERGAPPQAGRGEFPIGRRIEQRDQLGALGPGVLEHPPQQAGDGGHAAAPRIDRDGSEARHLHGDTPERPGRPDCSRTCNGWAWARSLMSWRSRSAITSPAPAVEVSSTNDPPICSRLNPGRYHRRN